jgi:phosphate transport system substrate-binding protein
MASAVNADPNAIGYVSYAFQRGAKPVTLVNECGLSMVPDAFSARTEEYPLNRRLYLYSRAEGLSQASRNLLEFATSDDADAVIAKSGFIDLGVDRKEQTLESSRANSLRAPADTQQVAKASDEMMANMLQFDRLSTTFRFASGSSRLDERGRIDLERLTRYIEDQPKGSTVKVVGFTDSVGSHENNFRLSERRAQQVAAELTQVAGDRLAHVTLETGGYGEIAPVACNTTAEGLQINRRVEIWISGPDAG